jgi:hypothetical protein
MSDPPSSATRALDDDASRSVGKAFGQLRVCVCPLLAEPDEVGVRIEDDETEVRLD